MNTEKYSLYIKKECPKVGERDFPLKYEAQNWLISGGTTAQLSLNANVLEVQRIRHTNTCELCLIDAAICRALAQSAAATHSYKR